MVATTIGMSRKLASMSNNPALSSVDEKYVGCSTSIGHSNFSFFSIALLSTCSSSSKSVIITNVGARGENCF